MRADAEQPAPAGQQVVEGELQPEVEQQQDQAEGGQQLEVVGVLDEDEARACWGRRGCRRP